MFHAAMKNNTYKAKKAPFKLDLLINKIDFGIDAKIHLFGVMINPFCHIAVKCGAMRPLSRFKFSSQFSQTWALFKKKYSESNDLRGVMATRFQIYSMAKNEIVLEKIFL